MSDIIYTILPVAGLLGLAFIGFGINIFFRKNGRFPETSVGRNREMQKRGITCVRHDEIRRCRAAGGKGISGCCSSG